MATVTIQFELMTMKWHRMTQEQRIAGLDAIEAEVRAAAQAGYVYVPPGPENPFPEWLRKEIRRTQGWISLRRIIKSFLGLFKIKIPLNRELFWDGENTVYKLVRVPMQQAADIEVAFFDRLQALKDSDPEKTKWCKEVFMPRVVKLQDSIVAVCCDEDLWPDGEMPEGREQILDSISVNSPKGKE